MKYWHRNLLLAAVLAGFGLMVTITSLRRAFYRISADFFHPFFAPVTKLESNTAEHAFLMQQHKSELAHRILELQRENDLLQEENRQLTALREENTQLRLSRNFEVYRGYRKVYAEIVRRDPVNWDRQFTVNKGREDGILAGCLVVARVPDEDSVGSRFAVVGRIQNNSSAAPDNPTGRRQHPVKTREAVVSTIISGQCSLSVQLPESDAYGIVFGGYRRRKKFWGEIHYLPRDRNYDNGEPVLTSGLTPWTPARLAVGLTATGTSTGGRTQNGLHQELLFQPWIDFDHLRFVIILVPEK